MRSALVVVAATLLVAGCGGSSVVVQADPVSAPYDGPMSLPADHRDKATVQERSGAAGRALECVGDPYAGGGASYDSGLESVQDSATDALTNLFEEDYVGDLPKDGYRVEREDDGRVLLSYDVGGRTKIAFVVSEDVKDFNGDTGWGVETWAECDPSELPASVTDDLDIDVWEDASGRRVPVTRIRSFQGAQHCDWQDITFLHLGPDRGGKSTSATGTVSSASYCARPTTALQPCRPTRRTPDSDETDGNCGWAKATTRRTW